MSRGRNRKFKNQNRRQNQPEAAAQATPKAPEPADVPDPELVIDERPEDFWAGEVDEKQLQLLMGDWRKGRTTRNIWQALSDAYVMIFSLLVIVAMLVSLIIQAQGQASTCSAAGCRTARELLPWAALAGVLAFAVAAARIFGPVLASAAEGFWLLDAPIRRSRILVKRLWVAVGAGFLGGAAIGALVSALTGSAGLAIVAWTAATGLAAAGVVAFAAAQQGVERVWTVKLVGGIAGLAGLGALLAVVGSATGWFHLDITTSVAVASAWSVAAGGVLLLVVSAVLARMRLNRIRRARLMSGGSLAAGMQGAAFALDFALMRDILQERDAVERGQVHPTRGRGLGLQTLIWRDVQRLIRFPKPLITLAVTAVVPYAVEALGMGRFSSTISALVLVAALVPFFTSLRVLSRTKGLMRCLPFSTSQVRTAASVVPGVLAGIWAIAVVPAFHGVGSASHTPWVQAVMLALITAAAGYIGAIRWVSAKSADYSAPMVATQMGAMPPGLMFNLVRGLDMVALITIWIVLGLSPWFSIVAAVIAYAILRMGGIDQQEMQQMQKDARRELEESRHGKPADKKVVTRRR
ncbi:DUF6297 family protein [Acidipropionibacterium jensenii]|uniref:ABC transporter permease n=1 Tax=Acidipropionibacterium jensenii TaxID=1749 RepID=A0A448P176_9ACTN|nr:DUF6297 family protein [Acidipropionibacterium jensenii]AZZ38841.1 ABC transporter permease [Acidipropionibacterium jensenii]MDN5976527.1 DUF6297 family protein [Acidipropionibacterium jensenii]MDN5995080.1 DUF6297 family protein [Acidipropionibacterium jensenii]MDN6426000.1 DUF6297 family protein [Acidipropionibacterium jensenii]MDN6440583.1 DUF6297 family protein [Acidipropionibacterium jensenii]